MVFQRRDPLTLWQKAREFFWPSMGFGRAIRYMKHRVIRMSDTSHKIALGLACGVAVSFTPLVGTHFIQAGVVAYLLRGNLLASLIGTFIGNPWTFPFLWWAAIATGSSLFGIIGLPASTALPDHVTFDILWTILMDDPLRIFLPWLVGGYILAVLSIPLSYYIFVRMVRAAKAARMKARMRKVHKVAKEVTGQAR